MGGTIAAWYAARYPDEVASLCAYLCSARASYITGQYMLVDGGRMEIYY